MSPINFKTGDLFDIIAQLQNGNDQILNGKKYVFLYVCANWSVVCKKMETETLTNQRVCDFLNANFLNLRVYLGNVPVTADITHKLSETLNVNVETLPHLLFLNHHGKVIHQAAGDLSPHDFILEAKAALSFKFNWV